jgi:ribosomal protein S30
MPKIGNDWELGNRPIKKNKKNLTQEVAKGKTVVSLTYKPTTKPKNHESIRIENQRHYQERWLQIHSKGNHPRNLQKRNPLSFDMLHNGRQ